MRQTDCRGLKDKYWANVCERSCQFELSTPVSISVPGLSDTPNPEVVILLGQTLPFTKLLGYPTDLWLPLPFDSGSKLRRRSPGRVWLNLYPQHPLSMRYQWHSNSGNEIPLSSQAIASVFFAFRGPRSLLNTPSCLGRRQ